jgi:hypothetical protein
VPAMRISRFAAAAAAGLALVAGGAAAAVALPSNPPTDARAAKLTVITRTIKPAPTSNRGFNGFQTVIVRPPAGRNVLQGFATMTGGQTGSVLIRSTRTFANRFVVNLIFPGEQGTPGTLHVLVQTLPRS